MKIDNGRSVAGKCSYIEKEDVVQQNIEKEDELVTCCR